MAHFRRNPTRVVFILLCFLVSGIVVSEERAALLIVNSRYNGIDVPSAADKIEKQLTDFGFVVTRRENLNSNEQKIACASFVDEVPTNGTALFFFSGLGATIDRGGKAYHMLRPVNQAIRNEGDYRKYGLNLGETVTQLAEKSGARANLIIVDVPTESPFLPEHKDVRSGISGFEVEEKSRARFLEKGALSAALEKMGKPNRNRLSDPGKGKKAGDAFVNSIGMSFRWCPPGKFTMGSRTADPTATCDNRAVEVVLSKGFWIGTYEVTQREYDRIARRTVLPEVGFKGMSLPYWGVTESKNIDDFCKKLNELERKSGSLPKEWEYQCPTEAEWEYACRAGTDSAFYFGDSSDQLGEFGNFADRSLHRSDPDAHWAYQGSDDGTGKALAPVGSYLPNPWGIYDMHGNVSEAVADHMNESLPGGTDPIFRKEKDGVTVARGGAWCSMPEYCESSFRNTAPRKNKSNFVGFRIALKKVK